MVFVAALALGATYAAWQASDTISGNTVSTATLKIDAYPNAAFGSDVKPVFATNVLPGDKSMPADRAEIKNESTVALDLWFYVDNLAGGGACDAVKLAWRASTPGDGSNYKGYGPSASDLSYETTSVVGNMASGNKNVGEFAPLNSFVGAVNAVKIADYDNGFGPNQIIAMRQVAGFAQDAAYPANSGTCTWTEYWVGTMPNTNPVDVVVE